jgi:hypothetical protein
MWLTKIPQRLSSIVQEFSRKVQLLPFRFEYMPTAGSEDELAVLRKVEKK